MTRRERSKVTSPVSMGCSGDFFNEVNDDMDDAPLREFVKMWDAGNRSWYTEVVKRIMNLEDVDRTVGHQCQHGAEYDGEPIKKPIG